MKVSLLIRRLNLAGGSVVTFPVGAYADKELASKAAQEQHQMLKVVMHQGRCAKPVQRPDGSMYLEDMGLGCGDLLAMVGVGGFDMQINEREVTETGLVVPSGPRLIVPGKG